MALEKYKEGRERLQCPLPAPSIFIATIHWYLTRARPISPPNFIHVSLDITQNLLQYSCRCRRWRYRSLGRA